MKSGCLLSWHSVEHFSGFVIHINGRHSSGVWLRSIFRTYFRIPVLFTEVAIDRRTFRSPVWASSANLSSSLISSTYASDIFNVSPSRFSIFCMWGKTNLTPIWILLQNTSLINAKCSDCFRRVHIASSKWEVILFNYQTVTYATSYNLTRKP